MTRRSRRTRWIARLALAATSATIGLVGTGAILSPASADSPTKVGWWNFASGGGQAAPAPDTNPGGLRVGVSSSQTLAFGAVEYQLSKDASATFELAITSITGNSNAPVVNQIYACPTKDDSWKAGDNQDASTAPAYDCDVRHFVGRLSSDQTTLTFQVDGSADVSDGVLSLAIVPAHSTAIPYLGTDPGTGTDLTPPFVVDFDKPGANSFVSDDSSSSSGSSGDSSSPPPPTDSGSSSSGSTAPPPTTTPPSTTDVSVPPATTDVGAGQQPVVAGQQPTGTSTGNGLAPAAAVAPTKADNHHDLLMVLLILLLFGILYMQQAGGARAPRNIGPRAAGGDEAAAVPPAYPVGYYGAPRGLGRFNKQRTGAARPLI